MRSKIVRAAQWLVMSVVISAAGTITHAESIAVVEGSMFAGPPGWQRLCAGAAPWCNRMSVANPTANGDIDYAVLAAIHRQVNAAIEPTHEPAGRDLWLYLPPSGDCEDYALSKKIQLIDMGIDPTILRFASAVTENGEYHVVLVVEALTGSWVLDNRFDAPIRPDVLQEFGYQWVGLEGRGDAGSWGLMPFGILFDSVLRAETDIMPAAGQNSRS